MNGWVCVSIGTCVCVRVCAGTCNKGGVNYYLKEKKSILAISGLALVLSSVLFLSKKTQLVNVQPVNQSAALAQGK